MLFKKKLLLLFLCIAVTQAFSQDPKLPPTNLGLSNLQDGKPPGTGWYFQQYVQNYSASNNRGANGEVTAGSKVNSLLAMSQLIWISNQKIAKGNLGFTVLIPVVRLSASDNGGATPSVNPDALRDIIAGPFIQWFDKRLFGQKFWHRVELDVVFPSGAYKSRYGVNPGSNLFAIVPHYTFTVDILKNVSISMRHILTYNFDQMNTQVKPGIFYNFNYSLEFAFTKSFKAELAGYYLTQLVQDSKNNYHDYFWDHFNITDTRERAFAIGPGLGFNTPSGLSLEFKYMWESNVRNRTQGIRTTLVLAYKLDK